MTEVEHLDLDDLLSLVRLLDAGPVRDVGLLEASVARPRASALGQDAYPTLAEKAAALLDSIARNHALVDGNKRLAWLSTVVFLDINHAGVGRNDDEAFALVLDVAAEHLEVPTIAERLRIGPAADE